MVIPFCLPAPLLPAYTNQGGDRQWDSVQWGQPEKKKIKTSTKSQSMKWALMCSVWLHHFPSITTSLLEECVLVSESHAKTHPPMWTWWCRPVSEYFIWGQMWLCLQACQFRYPIATPRKRSTPCIYARLFSSNRSLSVLLLSSERMPWDCAWVRTGDSSQKTTFHGWIKRLIRAQHVIQSVFHCYPMRSTQKIKDFLISKEA